MPSYAFTVNGQRLLFDGPNPQAAAIAARQWAAGQGRPGYAEGQRAGDPFTGYVTTAARAIPGLTELGAAYSAALRSADDVLNHRPADFSGYWNQARGEQQGVLDRFQDEHPRFAANATALATLAPAAVAGPLGLARAAPAAATVAADEVEAATPSLVRRWGATAARNGLTGAAVAGTYGFSQPGSLAERASEAANAAPGGALAGVALPAAVSGAGALARRFSDAATRAYRAQTSPPPIALRPQLRLLPDPPPPAEAENPIITFTGPFLARERRRQDLLASIHPAYRDEVKRIIDKHVITPYIQGDTLGLDTNAIRKALTQLYAHAEFHWRPDSQAKIVGHALDTSFIDLADLVNRQHPALAVKLGIADEGTIQANMRPDLAARRQALLDIVHKIDGPDRVVRPVPEDILQMWARSDNSSLPRALAMLDAAYPANDSRGPPVTNFVWRPPLAGVSQQVLPVPTADGTYAPRGMSPGDTARWIGGVANDDQGRGGGLTRLWGGALNAYLAENPPGDAVAALRSAVSARTRGALGQIRSLQYDTVPPNAMLPISITAGAAMALPTPYAPDPQTDLSGLF